MKVGIYQEQRLIAEIDGILRDQVVVDGHLLWQKFPDDLVRLLTEYSSAMEGISLHNLDTYQDAIQKCELEVHGDGIDGVVEDLQVFRDGASLVRISPEGTFRSRVSG